MTARTSAPRWCMTRLEAKKTECCFAHEQAEILQMEDAATSEDTVWNDLERKNGIGRLSKSRASLRHFWRLEKCTGKHPDGGKEPYLPLVGKQFEPHRKRDGQS
jgi:hypothetical protein